MIAYSPSNRRMKLSNHRQYVSAFNGRADSDCLVYALLRVEFHVAVAGAALSWPSLYRNVGDAWRNCGGG